MRVTKAIESVNARLRKIIKTSGHFPNDEEAAKLMWMELRNITAHRSRSARELDRSDEPVRHRLWGFGSRSVPPSATTYD